MNHTLTIPFNEKLLLSLYNKKIVARTDDTGIVNYIYSAVKKNNVLHAIRIDSDMPFTSIPFNESHINIPLAVFPSCFGSFKELIKKIDLLKKLNLRVYLSSDNEETFTAINILSSLGIHTALVFGDRPIDWDKTNDLMHYSVYSRVNHAPIEPFHYVATNYGKERFTCYSAVYFNDPSKFLHTDENQNIAFTHEELSRGDCFASGFDSLIGIQKNDLYKERMTSWQEFFFQEQGCAYCPSWRVCLGKFAERQDDKPGCRDFFSDLIDASCHYSSKMKNDKEKTWQP